MKRLKQYLQRFLLWIGATGLLLSMVACANVDQDEYRMPTETERMFTTAEQLGARAATPSDYQLPDGNYDWSVQSDDGNLNVTCNASVHAPQTSLFLAGASGEGFTQPQITGIFRYLFNGQAVATLIGKNVQTKASVQEQLDQMKQILQENAYSDYGFTKEEYEEAIARQEAALLAAPAASEGERISTDGTLLPVRDDVQGNYQALEARTEAGDTLSVRSAPANDRSQLPSTCRFERYGAPEYNMLDAVSVQGGDPLPQAAQGKLNRTLSEAKQLSDGLLASAGTDTTCLAAYVVGDRQTGNADGLVQAAAHYAYRFVYGRIANGVPVATDAWTEDDSVSEYPWPYEQIAVIVDDEGIAQFQWVEPVTVQNEETDRVSPISFPQATEIFEKMIPVIYGSQTYSANPKIDHMNVRIDVNDIQLSMLRIKNPSAESKTGLLVPAWVFYGTIVSQTFWNDGTADSPNYRQGMNGAEGCDFAPGPTIVLAINAVDGSIIDTSQGY